jgi:hypothetical protein
MHPTAVWRTGEPPGLLWRWLRTQGHPSNLAPGCLVQSPAVQSTLGPGLPKTGGGMREGSRNEWEWLCGPIRERCRHCHIACTTHTTHADAEYLPVATAGSRGGAVSAAQCSRACTTLWQALADRPAPLGLGAPAADAAGGPALAITSDTHEASVKAPAAARTGQAVHTRSNWKVNTPQCTTR